MVALSHSLHLPVNSILFLILIINETPPIAPPTYTTVTAMTTVTASQGTAASAKTISTTATVTSTSGGVHGAAANVAVAFAIAVLATCVPAALT
jgi:hypothetical protein